MKACGLIVEYNPFHNGHVYHLEEAKKKTDSDVVIGVMSGNFLQRGEPAIIDKWHRAEAALNTGMDVVLELPYVFAVQHADLFAKGAILTLASLNTNTVVFGSEQGDIQPFIQSYQQYKNQEKTFESELQENLNKGFSFPEASRKAYDMIDLNTGALDLTQPNNILGFSYVKAIYDENKDIKPETIRRTKSGYHDQEIKQNIASATSIRKEILKNMDIHPQVQSTIPASTYQSLMDYKHKTGIFHHWEPYFPYLQYKVMTESITRLSTIHGMEEGLEYRLKKTAKYAQSFQHWMKQIKTKRYTWTRLQRMFVHLLTNTSKRDVEAIQTLDELPYTRILGMTEKGRAYLHTQKKNMKLPLLSQLQQGDHLFLDIEEKAADTYYLPLQRATQIDMRKREVGPPIYLSSITKNRGD
ncbi:Predicted nucleotidyltransferase [Salinibacillus kushneri]|uniref:tRNA(Met) cytidine acetate ligase n=1 Tax=Salinibacillus kushneri TaxID=237682 RepID=A0A1I0HNZ7_9BACI|nr:nucleotidyltransferase [Salinibacillus kushneri]SET85789.1 Predicted nucleotidyltransferase [Salinibacillus kushneri]